MGKSIVEKMDEALRRPVSDRPRRIPPSTLAHCEVCGEALGYHVGSIMWQCQDRDLCPEHRAEADVSKITVKL